MIGQKNIKIIYKINVDSWQPFFQIGLNQPFLDSEPDF